MRPLGLAVGIFAAATFLIGFYAPGTMVFLLAIAAAASAATLFLSHDLSAFLKVFKAIFGVETIVFGLAFLIDHLGLWPKAYADYTLPQSLPFAVALFGVFIYAISFIPVVRKMTGIADRYFGSSIPTSAHIWPFPSFVVAQDQLAKTALVFLIVVNQAEVALDVRLSYFRADFTNALKNNDQPEFWHQMLLVFVPVVTTLVVCYVTEYVVTSTFVIRWRRWLTGDYIGRWLSRNTHYKMQLIGTATDNPDQRISEDIYRFIDGQGAGTGIYGYSITALQTLTSLVSYALVLWSLSSGFTLPGLAIVVPGILFWVALAYTGAGTAITHWIGRSLIDLYFVQQRFEADFRFGLARAREYSEQIALLHGEQNEADAANGRFGNIYTNYMRIVHVRKWLTAFTRSYNQASVLIPYVVAAPFYFAGKVTLGGLNQIGAAFNNVNESLNFFVTYYVSLADFKATLDRLTSFDESITRARALDTREPRIEATRQDSPDLKIHDLAVNLPDGSPLARVDDLTFAVKQPVLLVGPSGSGKSTLFRAVAGIWPFGAGRIVQPTGRMMVLPQRPYVPLGTLRNAIAYPAPSAQFKEAEAHDALAAAGLPHLIERLDDKENWQLELSGGEQQRLAIARALLAAPDWLLLDEATSALDEASEADMYRMLAKKLPETTLVSIGHRTTLSAFHQRRVELQKEGEGPARLHDVAAEA
jgi:putative ATP-binding cassette transporter